MANLLTRAEAGEIIFQLIKANIESLVRPEGGTHSIWVDNFPPDYPISERTIWNIRNGVFSMKILERLPFLEVRESFIVGPAKINQK